MGFYQLIEKASRVLEMPLPEVPVSVPPRFDDVMQPQRLLSQVPLLPGFQVCRQFEAPADLLCWSPACKKSDAMHGREQIAVAPFPLLGRAACPNRDMRMMDAQLAKLHRAMATQACLSNSTAILSLHVQHLARQLQASSGGPRWCRGAAVCLLSPSLAYERAGHCYRLLLSLVLGSTSPPLAVSIPAPDG